MREYQDIVVELVECLRETTSETAVSFNLFVNSESFSFKFNHRHPEQL